MPVYKDDKRGTWYVKRKYKNWKNEVKWITKRGFKTKREATKWEREFEMREDGNLDMRFADFLKLYREERIPRLKASTAAMKDSILETKLIPTLGDKPLREITTRDILMWQNEMLAYRDPNTGKPYSKSYLKTIHNQLSAVFNHAIRYYKLKENPAAIVGNMGSEKGIRMKYWTKDQYLRFSETIMDEPRAYYAFQMLYWCGIREGEMLALTLSDLDFTRKTVSVNKTFQHLKGQDLITEPKTPKSNREIQMPDFLVQELQDYVRMQYDLKKEDRLFPLTKSYLYRVMEKGSMEAGVPRIRIHDLRHSHVSLLIDMGYSAVAIADRMGHESIDITYRYAHLFPAVQADMASNALMEVRADVS